MLTMSMVAMVELLWKDPQSVVKRNLAVASERLVGMLKLQHLEACSSACPARRLSTCLKLVSKGRGTYSSMQICLENDKWRWLLICTWVKKQGKGGSNLGEGSSSCSWVELLLQQSAELKTLLAAHKDVLLQCPQAHEVVGAPHGDW